MSAEKTLKFLLFGEDRTASKTIKGVGDETDVAAGKFDKLKAAGVVAATAVVAGMAKFGADSVKAYADAEASARVLQDAYARFPATNDVAISAFQEQAAAIQSVTGADGDAINAAQGLVAQYGLTGKQIQDLTPLMVDYAAKTGKDLPAAAEDLGKAMLGQGRSLKEVGIDFVDTGSTAGNFEQIMAGLSTQVGGFAEKEGASAQGQLAILKETFGDLQEEVGAKLMPVLQQMTAWAITAVGWMTQHKDILMPIAAGIGAIAAAVLIWNGYQAVSNMLLAANPIGLVVVAIAALVAALIVAYNESETFRNIVQQGLDALYSAWQWLWNNGIAPVIRFILNGFANITEGIANMLRGLGNIPGFGWAKDAADQMQGAADKARAMAQGINDIPDRKTVMVTIDGQLTDRARAAVGTGGAGLTTRVFARGGFAAPGWALVGEEGPELVNFSQPGRVYTATQTRSMLSNTIGGGTGGGGLTRADLDYLADRIGSNVLAGAAMVSQGTVSVDALAGRLAGRRI